MAVIHKFNQIDINTEDIEFLRKQLNMEKRLNDIEKDLAEQKGKLTMVVKSR